MKLYDTDLIEVLRMKEEVSQLMERYEEESEEWESLRQVHRALSLTIARNTAK
jgi:hypothetical protein